MSYKIYTAFVILASACLIKVEGHKKICAMPKTDMDIQECCEVPVFVTNNLLESCGQHLKFSESENFVSANDNVYRPRPHPHPHPRPHPRPHPHPPHHGLENYPFSDFRKRTLSPCFIECTVNETDIYDDNFNINEPELQEFLLDVLNDDDTLLPVLEQSFKICAAKVAQLKAKWEAENKDTIQNDDGSVPSCSKYHTLMMGCAALLSFADCPSDLWADNEECTEGRVAVMQCINKF